MIPHTTTAAGPGGGEDYTTGEGLRTLLTRSPRGRTGHVAHGPDRREAHGLRGRQVRRPGAQARP